MVKKGIYTKMVAERFEDNDTEDELAGIVGGTRLFTKTMFIVYFITDVVLLIAHSIHVIIIMKMYIGTILWYFEDDIVRHITVGLQ